MAKVRLPKLWALTIASIWTYERPNSGQGARRYGPKMPAAQTSQKLDILSSEAVFGSYLRFQEKEMNTKLKIISWHITWTQNLHCLESGRGRYDAGKEGLRIRKIWKRLIFWKPSLLLSQGGSRARQGGALTKTPQEHKYNPLGAPRWLPIDIHSSESRRRSPQGGGCRGLAATPPELEDGED
jgi:hypothetical protein